MAQPYHFPTKADLFAKAVEHLCGLLFNEMRQTVDSPVEEAATNNICRALFTLRSAG